MSIPFLPAFLLAISIVFSAFKTPWFESLLAQIPTPLSSKFTSLASNSAPNQFKIGYSCPPFAPQRWPAILVIFTTSLYAIASALPPSLPTSYQHCSCLSWFSTCWRIPWNFLPHHIRSTDSYTSSNSI